MSRPALDGVALMTVSTLAEWDVKPGMRTGRSRWEDRLGCGFSVSESLSCEDAGMRERRRCPDLLGQLLVQVTKLFGMEKATSSSSSSVLCICCEVTGVEPVLDLLALGRMKEVERGGGRNLWRGGGCRTVPGIGTSFECFSFRNESEGGGGYQLREETAAESPLTNGLAI